MTKALIYEGLMKKSDALRFKRYWERLGWTVVLDSAKRKGLYYVYRISKVHRLKY